MRRNSSPKPDKLPIRIWPRATGSSAARRERSMIFACSAATTRPPDHIRELGGIDSADDRCFSAVDRVSQMNLRLYRTFLQPFVRAFVNPAWADAMRRLHPLRLQYEMFSNANPMMAPVAGWAERVRE